MKKRQSEHFHRISIQPNPCFVPPSSNGEEEQVERVVQQPVRPVKQPLRRKKQQHRPVRVSGRLIAFIVVLVIVVIWLFLRLAPVSFGQVRIDGNYTLTQDEIFRVGGISQPVNVVQLTPDSIRDRLEHDLRVSQISVSREFPATIHISLSERQPAAVITTMYGFAIIDETGVVMELAPKIKGASVPILTGKKMETLLLGDEVSDDSVRAALHFLHCLSDEDMRGIEEVNVGNPYDITAYTKDSIPIKLGSGDNMEQRAVIATELIQEVHSNRLDVQYIDTDLHSPFAKTK